MRSRTSRGVSEWSGGKELYKGSAVLAIGTSFGVIGIVLGPPEGPGGSTGWGHLPRGATWALVGAPWPAWAKGNQPQEAHAPRVSKGRSPTRGRPPQGALGGGGKPPLGRRPKEIASPRAGAPLGPPI